MSETTKRKNNCRWREIKRRYATATEAEATEAPVPAPSRTVACWSPPGWSKATRRPPANGLPIPQFPSRPGKW